ncbi:PhzF family phenazine biosynthesis protein [Parablastomonas sp. CN1-191]|uniref:PhzF family phenazine biosynthesis protein n=1 Tax=Parablastomonas sp. CN1-191 TaxID=3400908 RepID=UPI003BF922FC
MSPRKRPFRQVDVFTAVPFKGNPVAVVLDADGLDTARMQAFAAWTNLSETTFVTRPQGSNGDYAVRIFTPRSELPFAGHPTLGTAHAVIEAGMATARAGRLVQDCAAGLVDLDIGEGSLSFRLPRYALAAAPGGAAATAWIGAALAGDVQIADVGPKWHVGQVAEPAALAALTPDFAALADYCRTHDLTGSTLYAVTPDGAVTVRSFAPADGIDEDPVCGSGNGAVAAMRLLRGQVADGDAYVASQGREIGRDGHIAVRIEGRDIHVGGACVTAIAGTVLL